MVTEVVMGDRHDYVALEWVKGEIAETLKQAHHAIETPVSYTHLTLPTICSV